MRARHGVAILYDCHSIRSGIPFLFDGTLPDFNVGTADGASCAPAVEAAALSASAAAATGHSYVANGRFKGGWTTRHYGRPEDGVHAIQMELAQSTYLPPRRRPGPRPRPRRPSCATHLGAILETLAALAPDLRSEP